MYNYPFSGYAAYHNPYLYSQIYPASSYYYGYYYPYYRRPGLFRGLLNRIMYGSYYGNPYPQPIMYDSHGRRIYPGETNYVSSVKDLWKSDTIY